MKKICFKNITALVLAFSLIASCFAGLPSVITSAQSPVSILNDDFENYGETNLADVYETIEITDTYKVSELSSQINLSSEKGRNDSTALLNASVSQESAVRSLMTTLKEEYTPKGKINEYSFYYNVTKTFYDSHLAFVPYFVEKENYLVVDFYLNTEGKFDFRTFTPKTSVPYTFKKVSSKTEESINFFNSSAQDYDAWIKYSFRYDYEISDNSCVLTIHLDVSNAHKTIEDYAVYEISGASDRFRTGFTADWGNSNNPNYIDDIVYDITSYEEMANTFKTNYSEFLNNTSPTEDEIDTYNSAIADYKSFPKSVKELLASEKALIDGMKEKIIASIPQTKILGLNEDYFALGWNTEKVGVKGFDVDTAEILSDSEFTSFNGEKVFKPIKSSRYKSMITSTPTEAVWPIKTLNKMEISFKIDQDGWWDNNPAIYTFLLDNEETGYNDYLGVQYTANASTKGFSARPIRNDDKVTINNVNNFWNENTNLDTTDWIKLTVDYDYSDFPRTITLKHTFSDVNGESISSSRTYQFKYDVDICDFSFKVGIGSSYNQAKVYFKDLNLTFSVQDKDLAAQFLKKHEELLATESYTPSLDDEINAMAEEFFTCSKAVQKLIKETGKLDAFISVVKVSSSNDELNTFMTAYNDLLANKKISTSDIDLVKVALVDYDALSKLSKLMLYKEKGILDNFADEFDIVRDDDDYSDFKYNFDDGVNPFREVTKEPTIQAENEIVIDPDDETGKNKVLKLGGRNDIFLIKYWPTLGAVKQVSFTIKTKSEIFTKSRMFLGYEDSENYYSAAYDMVTELGTVYGTALVDNVSPGHIQFNDVGLDFTQKMEITMLYTDSAVTLTATHENKSYSWTVNYARGGAFGFGYICSKEFEHISGNPMYIDDLQISFENEAGDFDTNDVSTAIDIYYSGNTFLNPDETISLIGNKLWQNAQDEVLIYKVPDAEKSDLTNADNKIGVVEQIDYSTKGENNSAFVLSENHTFDESQALTAKLLQRSTMAMEVVIPGIFEKGIYALKLSPKQEGEKVAYLYVNCPKISFATGDEGNIATRGGSLRIVGSNLVPTGNADDVSVRLISKTNGDNFDLSVALVYEDDAYSLTVNIPEDFPIDDYEIYVHNGYGDNTCWSLPAEISVGASPRDAWRQDIVFNVTDAAFGATGDGKTNDTPAIIKALQAAAEVKGTVYFPRGKYRIVTTLAIPECVTLKGDGVDDTIFDFSATNWQYGNCPSLISIIGNVEIEDICFYGTRSQRIIKLADTENAYFSTGEYSDNVYIKNVKMRFSPATGILTDGGGYGRPANTASVTSIYAAVRAEVRNGCQLDWRSGASNLQVDNMSFEFATTFTAGGSAGPPMMRIRAEQVQIRNSFWTGYSLGSSSYGMIVEDCDLQDAAFNPSGNGFYFARNYLHHSTGNNRELLTTDGKPAQNNVNCWFIGERSDVMQEAFGSPETDETIFLLTTVGSQSKNLYKGYNFVVVSGQGIGQVRRITDSGTCEITQNGKKEKRTWVKVNEPFKISPNRRSKISISEPRDQWFFIDNDFFEGGASGSYGMMINSVWDGNDYHRHEGQYFFANGTVQWYMTLKDQYHYDAAYISGDSGSDGSFSDIVHNRNYRSQLDMQNATTPFASLGFAMRGCRFSEYGFAITQGTVQESITGFVMENCEFSDRQDNPIEFTTSLNGCGSLLFRNNRFETVGEFNNIINPEPYNKVNSCGYKIIIIINSAYEEVGNILGDVNLDGYITLKDVTFIRFYIVGMINLDEQQLINADVNTDGKVSLKDVSIIRYWLITDFTDIGIGNLGGGTSSDDSSSDSSSGNDINVSLPGYSGDISGDDFTVSSKPKGPTVTKEDSSEYIGGYF